MPSHRGVRFGLGDVVVDAGGRLVIRDEVVAGLAYDRPGATVLVAGYLVVADEVDLPVVGCDAGELVADPVLSLVSLLAADVDLGADEVCSRDLATALEIPPHRP